MKNERYYTGNSLNKWFAISSILFFLSIILTFIDDNDDEFKEYQRSFRKMEIQTSKNAFNESIEKVSEERILFEKKLLSAQEIYNKNNEILSKAERLDEKLEGKYYKANMEFLAQKAELDALKYRYESEIIEQHNNDHQEDIHPLKYEKIYNDAFEKWQELKLIKEIRETDMLNNRDEIKKLKSQVKLAQDELNVILKEVNLAQSKLEVLDREKMSFSNKVADIIRDLPIIDFMDPYYEVKQVVLEDIKYDVNFASVPVVDRCTSCHLGIDKPEYKDAQQPYTSHPNLELFLTSASKHPFEEYGCTSCHAGRSRGTSFVSAAHTPQSKEQQKEWEEKYGWYKMHHWTEPMLPTKYTESSCFTCHQSQPFVKGGEKLALGLSLIDKSGCNNCHLIENYNSAGKNGPPLTHLEEKLNKEWVTKWIKDPQSFRYNTWMPHFFNQENNSSPEMIKRNNTEIYAITEYLFNNKNKTKNYNSKKYLGDATTGESLFNSVGCRGCHVIEQESVSINEINSRYEFTESKFGYEPDPYGESYERTNRYNLLKYQGPNLIGMGSKTDAKWIYNWIKNPEKYWPDTKMPNLRLTDKEARDITSYLLTFTNEKFENLETFSYDDIELKNIAKGWLINSYPESEAEDKINKMTSDDLMKYVAKKSISFYGCYTCHNIKDYEKTKPIGAELTTEGSKPVGKLDFGHIHHIDHTNYEWFEQKLAKPRIFDRDKIVPPEDKSRMPNFYFKPEEIEAITTAILGFNSNIISDNKKIYNHIENKLAFDGYSLIQKNNCQGCHIINDFGGQISDIIGAPEYSPPNLNTQGTKTQPDWLFNFFNNPMTIRPNLQVRMPSFNFTDVEWNSIIAAFQDMEKHQLTFENDLSINTKTTKYKAGEKIHEFGDCSKCHFYGTEFPKGDPQTWAPNLALTKERLRPEWIIEWLSDPQSIMPGTKMPAPYLPDSDILSTPDAIDTWGKDLVMLKGDKDEMLDGLKDYIYSLSGKIDISKEVKSYFKKNGYEFMNPEEEEDDDDDW